MPKHLDAGGVEFHATHPFSSLTSKACISQLVRPVSRKSSVRKAHHILNDPMAKKVVFGSAVQELSNPLVPIPKKKSSNLLVERGVKCKRIARLQKRNNKPQDHEQVTDEHVHNASLDNANKVASVRVSRSVVSRNNPIALRRTK
tara:strand:- start:137 stop:571 length:435 start_codon:yes stop_codon:yes gene_type:complete